MALIEWKDSYSIGLASIDEQHKKLIGIMNSLAEAMHAKKSKDVIGQIIQDLSDYTVYHFGTEEKYMKEFNYPDYEEHKKAHEYFVSKVEDFKKKNEESQGLLSVEVLLFLRDWFIKHILGTDKKYVPFFKERGVK